MYSRLELRTAEEDIIRISVDKPSAVQEVIPDAVGVINIPTGGMVLDIPWTFSNMQLLSLLGEPALSPILRDYSFPGVNKPYHHQKSIAEFLSRNPRAYCFAGMGTGKTRAACWAFDYLMSIGEVKKVLVVCPKTLMHLAWEDDLRKTCIHRVSNVLYGTRERRRELAELDTSIDIINFDGLETVIDILVKKNYDLIVIDESTAVKDTSTKRWKLCAKLVSPNTRVWGLTGTPTPNGPADAYGQGRLINPTRLPRTKSRFREMTETKISTFVWKPRPNWKETVREVLRPAIYISKNDHLDLPPVTRTYREVGLSKQQKTLSAQLRTDYLLRPEGGQIVTAVNALALMSKLRQIYAGAIYSDDGEALVLDNKARLETCIELIRQVKAEGQDLGNETIPTPHSKALVFVPFKHVADEVCAELSKHFNVKRISGDTSASARRDILSAFQTEWDIDVIVAIPEAFSHGVTATAASLTIWYAPPIRPEVYIQACERTDRPGQTQHQNIVHLFGDAYEQRMYKALSDSVTHQDALLELYRDFYNT